MIQTCWSEALGVAVVSPLFAHFALESMGDSFMLLIALSVVVMAWSALYNTVFDRVERHCTGRVASDRPQGLRIVHAVGLEATACMATGPLIVALTSLGWRETLVAQFGLTLAYALYGYLFHLGFDRLRPVGAGTRAGRGTSPALGPIASAITGLRSHGAGRQVREAGTAVPPTGAPGWVPPPLRDTGPTRRQIAGRTLPPHSHVSLDEARSDPHAAPYIAGPRSMRPLPTGDALLCAARDGPADRVRRATSFSTTRSIS